MKPQENDILWQDRQKALSSNHSRSEDLRMVFIGIAIAILIVGALIIGHAAGSVGQSPVTINRDPKAEDCKTACANLLSARGTLCSAKAEADRALAKANAAEATHTATLVLAIAATVAAAIAWALTMVPIVGLAALPFAIALTVVAVALSVIEAGALAALIAAQSYAAAAAAGVANAQNAVIAAVAAVRSHCPTDEAERCIALPAGC